MSRRSQSEDVDKELLSLAKLVLKHRGHPIKTLGCDNAFEYEDHKFGVCTSGKIGRSDSFNELIITIRLEPDVSAIWWRSVIELWHGEDKEPVIYHSEMVPEAVGRLRKIALLEALASL
jgi:hypothetical protein